MSKLINLTPHDIKIYHESGGGVAVIPASGWVARLAATTIPAGTIRINERWETRPWNDEGGIPDGNGGESFLITDDIPLSKTEFGEPDNLPEPEGDTYYIVSGLIKSAFPEREDLLVPVDFVRDEKGVVLGCKSLGI